MLIEQRIRQSHNSLLQDKELDIAITDICFDYTNGFHLKLLSYVGFSANRLIAWGIRFIIHIRVY
jgi:hypothetical protein